MPTQPWEQLPDESAAAYSTALAYFQLGPSRTLAKLRKTPEVKPKGRASNGQATGKPKESSRQVNGNLSRWSKRYRWVERAAAYDAHLATINVQAHEDAARAAAEKKAALWSTRLDERCEVAWITFHAAARQMKRRYQQMNRHDADPTQPPVADDELRAAIRHVAEADDRLDRIFAIAQPAPLSNGQGSSGHAEPIKSSITPEEAAAIVRTMNQIRNAKS